jgi:hypothetical protein
MKLYPFLTLLTITCIITAFVMGQNDNNKNTGWENSRSDSVRALDKIEQWQSVSLITNYMKAQGMKKVNNNVDTIFNLLNKKKRRKVNIVVKYIAVPIYVPITDSLTYVKKRYDTLSDLYIDTVNTKRKSILKRLFKKQN